MIKLKTGLAAVLDRAAAVARRIRPATDTPPPPFERCAGCRRAGRDDQQVPDPDQFVNKLGQASKVVGHPAVDVDAPAPFNPASFNLDPGAAAARLSRDETRRGGYAPDVKLIDAAPVHCSCGQWFHAIGCYSTHRTDQH